MERQAEFFWNEGLNKFLLLSECMRCRAGNPVTSKPRERYLDTVVGTVSASPKSSVI
jgi:hypothetical protein